MREKLKPCPFCGREAEIVLKSNGYAPVDGFFTQVHKIWCPHCGCQFNHDFNSVFIRNIDGEFIIKEDGLQQAKNAWNRRTKESAEQALRESETNERVTKQNNSN